MLESLFNPFLIKLQDWWPKTLLKKDPNTVFSCECLKMFEKNLLWNTSGGCFLEWFWRISNNFWRPSYTQRFVWFHWSERENCKILATFCIEMWMIRFLKDQMSSYLLRFVWNEEIKQIRVTQILLYKLLLVKLP